MVLNFICRDSKKGKNGLSPIELSIIVDGKRKVITLDKRIKASSFNPKQQKCKDKLINEFIELTRAAFYKAENELIKRGITVNVENIIKAWKGGFEEPSVGVLEYFSQFNREYLRGDVSYITSMKYKKVLDYLKDFIKEEYNADEYCISDITIAFCQKFFNYLLKFNKNNSAVGKMKVLKTMFSNAVYDGKIKTHPMAQMKFHLDKVDTTPLSMTEINTIINKKIENERLSRVRDLFVFMCYSGLAYCDAVSLTKDDIKDGVILKRRAKTSVQSTIPLLPIAKEILEKYEYKLPSISNQKMNSYLGEIESICNIKTHLHCHLARHTFACLLLNNGVDMETISKVLGHSSSKITASTYAIYQTNTIKDAVLAVANKLQ